MIALAQRITAKQGTLPAGLVDIGTPGAATWARSACQVPHGVVGVVSVVRGDTASRIAFVMADPEAIRWDEGDATIVVVRIPPRAADGPRPSIRDASPGEWQRLLRQGNPETAVTTLPPSRVPNTP